MQQRYGLSPGAMNQQQGPSSDQISEFMEGCRKAGRLFQQCRSSVEEGGTGSLQLMIHDVGQILIKKGLSFDYKQSGFDGPWASWRWECHCIQTRLVRPKFLIQSRSTTA